MSEADTQPVQGAVMPEITDSELRLFARYQNLGTPEEVARKISDLEADNKKYRDRIKETEAKVPGADQVVLTKADADELAKFRELGKPDVIQQRISEGDQLRVQMKELATRQAAQGFIRAAGLADETLDTLVAIPGLKDAKFEVRKQKVKDAKGQEVEVDAAYVLLPGEEKAMSFEAAKDRVPALKGLRMAEVDSGQPGQKFFKMSPKGEDSPATIYDKIRQEAEAKKQAAKAKPAAPSLEERLGMTRA